MVILDSKFHKANCPVIPILSTIGTYNYKLAKFLVPILQPFTSNLFTVKDSFCFVNEISSLSNHSYFMASFDVTSLFTNLPMEECIDLCVNQLFSDRDVILHNDCRLDKLSFRRLPLNIFRNPMTKRFLSEQHQDKLNAMFVLVSQMSMHVKTHCIS